MRAGEDPRRGLLIEDERREESGDIEHDVQRDSTAQQIAAPGSTLRSSLIIALLAIVFLLAGSFILSDWSKYMPRGDSAIHEEPHSHEHDEPVLTHPEPTPIPHDEVPMKNGNYVLDSDWDFEAAPIRREYDWTIQDAEYNPDGVFRPMILINNRFPGPLIEVNEGDTIVVHVLNKAVNSTSIHWHGLYQNGTNWMDGTVGVTSCPISPGAKFTYEFKVEGQSGSYYYHAHHGLQGSDGLYGPLIIHSKEERKLQTIKYTTDQVVLFSDHYHDLSTLNMMKYLKSDRENTEPVPDGALINGLAVRDCSKLPHRKCDNMTENIMAPKFDLRQGESHRLRIINSGAFAEFQISIDEHDFAITEVDGVDVHPVSFHRLNISPGQRYSIVLNTTLESRSSYWLRAKMVRHCFGERNPALEPEIWAPVNYIPATDSHDAIQKPMSKDWPEPIELQCRDLNTSELHPVVQVAAPSQPDATFHLRANFEIGAYRLSRGFFNQSTWRANVSSPTLFRAMDSISAHEEVFSRESAFINNITFDDKRELVIQTRGLQVIDLIISNFDDGYHPFHLHGYKYFVLAQGRGYPAENLTDTLDLSNPLRRDTASVEGYGWMLIRIVADNPGAWALHCHVSWHTEAGLLMQLLTRVDRLGDMEIPQSNRALCASPLADLKKGMTPDDEVFYDDD